MASSFDRSRSTRRTATVTTSAPDASIASIICALDAYLPVPTIRRERNSCPATTNGSGSASAAGEGKTARSLVISPSADEVDDLEHIVGRERDGSKGRAIAQNYPVVLDDDRARLEFERRKQVCQRPARWDPALCSIDRESDPSVSYF